MSDLQHFKKLFGYEVSRESDTTLHYRIKGSVDWARKLASKIIEHNNLTLKVVSTGNMAQLKAFEIKAL